MNIQIVSFEPKHQVYFESLNKSWIEKYFRVEALDEYVLTNPQEAIIKPGGTILMALYEGEIAGTVALKKLTDNVFELTKMAVAEPFRRKGIAESLVNAALEKAGLLGAQKIILYSQTVLEPAIRLYNKLGFEEVAFESSVYSRANIKMELILKSSAKNKNVNILNPCYGND